MAYIISSIVILIVMAVLVKTSLIIVHQAETMVIERFGSYNRTLKPGIRFVWPFFEGSREIEWKFIESDEAGKPVARIKRVNRIDLRETIYDFPKQTVITKDNVLTEIDALVYFQVINAKKVVYEIANLPEAIKDLTQTTLRNVIGELTLDESLSSRNTVNNRLKAILNEAADKWGVKVNRVELQDIIPPKDVHDAMQLQMRAERSRRANILEAEGEKKARILMAEGEAMARVRVAQAEAEVISRITEAVKNCQGDPMAYLLAMRYIDTFKEMVSGKDNKVVYLPYEATGVLGSISSIKDLFEGLSHQQNNEENIKR